MWSYLNNFNRKCEISLVLISFEFLHLLYLFNNFLYQTNVIRNKHNRKNTTIAHQMHWKKMCFSRNGQCFYCCRRNNENDNTKYISSDNEIIVIGKKSTINKWIEWLTFDLIWFGSVWFEIKHWVHSNKKKNYWKATHRNNSNNKL